MKHFQLSLTVKDLHNYKGVTIWRGRIDCEVSEVAIGKENKSKSPSP